MTYRQLLEAKKDISAFIKYIPKNFTKVEIIDPNVKGNFIIGVSYKTEEGFTNRKDFIIHPKGALNVRYAEDDETDVVLIKGIGRINMYMASGMVKLSKALKTQSLIGDFEEWLNKIHKDKK